MNNANQIEIFNCYKLGINKICRIRGAKVMRPRVLWTSKKSAAQRPQWRSSTILVPHGKWVQEINPNDTI